MKKIFALTMALILVGCGTAKQPAEASTEAAETDTAVSAEISNTSTTESSIEASDPASAEASDTAEVKAVIDKSAGLMIGDVRFDLTRKYTLG